MTDTTKTDALNSFSLGSVLSSIWDTATNTFNTTVRKVESTVMNSLVSAQTQAQSDADNAKYSLPVTVQGGLDTTTMLFLGAVALSVVLLLKKK